MFSPLAALGFPQKFQQQKPRDVSWLSTSNLEAHAGHDVFGSSTNLNARISKITFGLDGVAHYKKGAC